MHTWFPGVLKRFLAGWKSSSERLPEVEFPTWDSLSSVKWEKTKPFINVDHDFIKYLFIREQNNIFIKALPVLFNNNYCSTNLKIALEKGLFQYYCHFCVILYQVLLFHWCYVENIHFCNCLGKKIKKSIYTTPYYTVNNLYTTGPSCSKYG